MPGLEFSLNANVQKAKFDSTVTDFNGDVIGGIEKGNRLPTVPKYQIAAVATYGQPINDTMDWSVTGSVQRIGNRWGEPGDQVPGAGSIPNALSFDPITLTPGGGAFDFGSLRLPAYTLVNLSTTLSWASGLDLTLYVKNLLDTNPKLAIDRERNLRARFGYLIGQPRTIGLTARMKFSEPVAVAAAPPVELPPPPPPPPATQTCADGSVVLATEACPVPPPPPPPPPPAPERG